MYQRDPLPETVSGVDDWFKSSLNFWKLVHRHIRNKNKTHIVVKLKMTLIYKNLEYPQICGLKYYNICILYILYHIGTDKWRLIYSSWFSLPLWKPLSIIIFFIPAIITYCKIGWFKWECVIVLIIISRARRVFFAVENSASACILYRDDKSSIARPVSDRVYKLINQSQL